MGRRRSLAALIGRHFASFRKSRRTTITALVFGLLMGRRLGLAAIARRMAGPVSVRHKIKRVGRFADNRGVRVREATPCLVEWVLSLTGKAPGSKAIEKAYRRRCWIEEHSRDAKSGLGLSGLRLRRAHRIERLLIVAAVATLVAIAVGMGWNSEHGDIDPQMTSHKRGRSLSVVNLGCELIWALMIGPLPLSLLDRPLPLPPHNTL